MPLPTLMLKGNLRSPNGDPELEKELKDHVPIDYIIDWFRSRLTKTGIKNRVLVLKSETASGKSTALPPTLFNRLVRGKSKAGIICTQPRIATAIENVMEMLKFESNKLQLGVNIGWSTKFNKFRPTEVGLLSATVQTLTQQLKVMSDESIMETHKYILIDETHERDLPTDMTVYMLKNLLLRNQDNPNCPFVVLMSATFDPDPFLRYFDVPRLDNFIWCGGQTAEIEEKWDWNEGRTVNNYTQAAKDVVKIIVTENPDDEISKADILIFMPGMAEFKETAKYLSVLNKELADAGKKVFSILQVDGTAFKTQNRDFMMTLRIDTEDHEVVIGKKTYTPNRRVVIATNVAETGLTLENLKYVIDSGFNREIEFNPILGLRALITKPAPQSRIHQRRGRAGRKFDGFFYPLYPEYIHKRLPAQQFPTILTDDVSSIFLDIVNQQLKAKHAVGEELSFAISDIDMIDTPTPDAIHFAVEKLYTLGFISPNSPQWEEKLEDILANEETEGRFGITKLGSVASMFSMMPPETARMILASYFWECAPLDVVAMASYMILEPSSFTAAAKPNPNPDLPPVRVTINWTGVYRSGLPRWISSSGMLYKIRLLIADEFIDGIILYSAIRYVIASAETNLALIALGKWCELNNVSYNACLMLIRQRDDIIEEMIINGLDVFALDDQILVNTPAEDFMTAVTKLKYCIYDGYRNNLIIRDGEKYETLSGLRVEPPPLFRMDEQKLAEKNDYGFAVKTLPKYLLYRELSIKFNRKTSIYDVIALAVSTMDGFVSIDADFSA